MSYPLVCLGNPLLDLQVNVDAEYLKKYNLKENDAILAEENHLPIYDEILKKDDLILVAGGAAQNTARGAQYILPQDSVVYFGAVGKDVYSEKLEQANAKYGLLTRYQYHQDIPTGKCAALINGNHRSLVTDLAAANHFTPDHLDIPENWKFVENASHFYIGGFHLTVSPPAIAKLGQHAAANKKTFALNLSAPFIPQFFKDPLDDSIKYCDFIIGNESEAAAYGESHGLNTSDVTEIAKHIAQLPKENDSPRTVVFTQGTDPTITVTFDFKTKDFEINEYPVRELPASKITDTNGAGDAFASGFIASLVEGKSISQAVDVGQWAACVSIQQVGPSFPFPKVTYQ